MRGTTVISGGGGYYYWNGIRRPALIIDIDPATAAADLFVFAKPTDGLLTLADRFRIAVPQSDRFGMPHSALAESWSEI